MIESFKKLIDSNDDLIEIMNNNNISKTQEIMDLSNTVAS